MAEGNKRFDILESNYYKNLFITMMLYDKVKAMTTKEYFDEWLKEFSVHNQECYALYTEAKKIAIKKFREFKKEVIKQLKENPEKLYNKKGETDGR